MRRGRRRRRHGGGVQRDSVSSPGSHGCPVGGAGSRGAAGDGRVPEDPRRPDPARLAILAALARSELCVCDISAVLGLSVSAASHRLALLRAQRLVSFRREGKVVYYSLADDHVHDVLRFIREHLAE